MLATIALVSVLLGTPQKDDAAINAACAQIAKASQARDWKKLESLCTKDFKQHTLQGDTITLKDLERNLNGLQNLKFTYKVLSVESNGKVAKAKVFWSVKGTFNRGGKHTFQGDDTEIDTFKKVNGKWLESEVKELTASQKVGGRVVPSGTDA